MPAHSVFQLPVWFDLGATFAFALTGALAAIKRGYDVVGLFFLALVSGIGGGLIRDGLFLNKGTLTPLLTDPSYLYVISAAAFIAAVLRDSITYVNKPMAVIDALGLGAYACFGLQKAIHAGLSAPAAILVGVINAVGGGILRDLLTREEPLVFKPGHFYVLVAFAGAVSFFLLSAYTTLTATQSALIAIGLTLALRLLTLIFNWRSAPIAGIKLPALDKLPKP